MTYGEVNPIVYRSKIPTAKLGALSFGAVNANCLF